MTTQQPQPAEGLNFSRFVAQTVGLSVFGHALSLLASILVARSLGPSGKGVVAVVILYPTFLFTLGHLSVYRAVVSRVSSPRYQMRDFCGTLGFFALAMSALLLLGFGLAYRFFPYFFIHSVRAEVLWLGLSILPLFLINQLYGAILQARGEIAKFNRVAFSQTLFSFVALSLMYAAGGLTIWRVVFSYAIANVLAASLAFGYTARLFPGGWVVRWELLKDLVTDGLKLHAGIIGTIIFLKIDQLMLAQYRGASSVGLYTVSVSYAELLLIVPAAIQNVFYGKISRMLSEKIDLVPGTLLVYRHNAYLLFFSSLALASLAYPTIFLFYGRSFTASTSLFFILLPGIFFLYLNNILTNFLVATRNFWVVSLVSIGAALINVLLNMFFIPRWGAVGAAFSSCLTYLAVGTSYIIVFMRLSRVSAGSFWRNLLLTPDDLSLYKSSWRSIFFRKVV